MKKTKIQGISLLALLFFAGLIWLYPALKKKPAASRIKKTAATNINIGTITTENNYFALEKELEAKRSKLIWSRDPFQPGKTEPIDIGSPLAGLKLSGIARDDQGKLAIINGDIVRAGDYIKNYTIIKIAEDYVIISIEGEEYTLKLY